MTLIRPNGLIERLSGGAAPRPAFDGYGRSQPGPTTPEALRSAKDRDRRRGRRPKPDPLRGRLIDLTT